MTTHIQDQETSIDLFLNTHFLCAQGDLSVHVGKAYLITKDEPKRIIEKLLAFEIKRAISREELPPLHFQVTGDDTQHVLMYRVTILEVLDRVVSCAVLSSNAEVGPEESSIGDVELTDLGHYIRDKILQILWKYNADARSLSGQYGCTHFNQQIVFSRELIERQIRKFGIRPICGQCMIA